MNTIISQYTQTPNNLLALLSHYRVVVPGIQRHYVQGSNTSKAYSVRIQFVNEIFSLIENNEELHLHFIYGPIDTDGEDSFVPVDGQQRLTTLWLIARYATERLSGIEQDKVLKLLSRFSYADRVNAARFCYALTLSDSHWNTNEDACLNILKQPWFLDYWKEDETVASMLRMLSTIHDEWQKHNITGEQVLEALGGRVLFELKTDAFGDDIYMKMNARGLELTQWENFKSKFAEHLGDDKSKWEEDIEELSNKFFEKSGSRHELPDNSFFALFVRITAYTASVNQVKCSDNIKKLAGYVHESWEHIKLPFVPFSDFLDLIEHDKSLGLFIANKCSRIIDIALQCHDRKVPYFGEITLFETLFHPKNQNELDYGICCYEYFKAFENVAEDDFLQASRLMWNILENVNRQDNEFNRIAIIKKFISLENPSLYSPKAFDVIGSEDSGQVVEEAEKAIQMHNENQECPSDWDTERLGQWIGWRYAIEKAEETAFFNGSIRFLYQGGSENSKWELFATKLIHCLDLFNKEGLNTDKKIIANRALISHCKNWEIIRRTPVFGSKKDNWKRTLIKKSLAESVNSFLIRPDYIAINSDDIINKIIDMKVWSDLIEDNENYELEYKVGVPCLWLNRYLSCTLKLQRNNGEDVLDEFINNANIRFELKEQDRFLTLNDVNYYYAIPIFFRYSYNGEEYRFAWQTWGWLDMYDKFDHNIKLYDKYYKKDNRGFNIRIDKNEIDHKGFIAKIEDCILKYEEFINQQKDKNL